MFINDTGNKILDELAFSKFKLVIIDQRPAFIEEEQSIKKL